MPLALGEMMKTVPPTSVSPDGSVIPEAVRLSVPQLVKVGLPADLRPSESSEGLPDYEKPPPETRIRGVYRISSPVESTRRFLRGPQDPRKVAAGIHA